MNEQEQWNKEHLESLEEDMNDDYKSWQEAEKEIKETIEWRDKQALRYAMSTVKYYNYKKEIYEI